ncbi:helix-turn-helix transcriptional regulator [Paenibacillus senegalimassiliensis]|uniref:helix-turn-helix transcriptional regulator n=1 Tax=Paenibacillus senegalimassiliensis TaxID=1737426 RepID=UPI00073E891F|nr:helix-turn-helix transcriptional regulator [Paenibacillus senegalimassiliensis]
MKNKIEFFRREYQMTQQELAERVNVSRQTIISLERGRYSPSIRLAYNIARVFNTTIEQVFIFDEEE